MFGFNRRGRMLALIGLSAAAFAAGAAYAEPAPPFVQLLRASSDAPRLEILDADVARAEGLARQAGASPNPIISLMGENFGGSDPYGAFGRVESTLQYSQPIELGGKKTARVAAGQASVLAAQASNHEGRVNYAYELVLAYAAVEVADRRIAIASDGVADAIQDLKVAKAMVSAGKDSQLRQLQAETELNTLQAEYEAVRASRVGALARLTALAGSDETFTGVSESLFARVAAKPAVGPVDPLQNAAYLSAEAERQAAVLRAEAERRRASPDVTAQIGVRRLQGADATALVAGISIPLNLFDANKGNIAAAQAESRGADARVEVARLEAQAAAQSAIAQVDAADAQADAAAKTQATAEEAYRLVRIAYDGGKAPLSEVITARRSLSAARAVVLNADIARLQARATIARLQGLTITGEPVQ
ncbi:MAG: metal transporter [Sphingomonadales bacterium 63-6]|nr:MAG: metal transporter [Sphingomonadales bacterium 63-6]